MTTSTNHLQLRDNVEGVYKTEPFKGVIVEIHQTDHQDIIRSRVQFDKALSMGFHKFFYTLKDGSSHSMTNHQCLLKLIKGIQS